MSNLVELSGLPHPALTRLLSPEAFTLHQADSPSLAWLWFTRMKFEPKKCFQIRRSSQILLYRNLLTFMKNKIIDLIITSIYIFSITSLMITFIYMKTITTCSR